MSAPDIALAPSTDTATHRRIRDPRLLALARLVWAALALLGIGLFVAGLPVQFSTLRTVCEVEPCLTLPFSQLRPEEASFFQQLGLSLDFYAWYALTLEIVGFLTFAAVAVLIFWRKSDDWMALWVSLMLVTFGTASFKVIDTLVAVQPIWHWPLMLMQVIGIGSFGTLFYLFPDGRFVPRWTRWLALTWLVTVIILVVIGRVPTNPDIVPIFSLAMATSIAAQVYRYRRVSTPLQRQQTKWVVVGLAAAVTCALILFAPTLIFPSLSPVHGSLAALYLNVILAPPLIAASSLIPVTITISMLRYRLWDVDFFINRGLVYGGLTLALGVVFLVGLFLLQSVLGAVLGGEQTTTAAIISTAVIVGLFNPTRRRLQSFVDHRFYRLRLDLNQLAEAQKLKALPNPGAMTGAKLGAYQVGEVLGRGGMGEVYKGHQTELGRTVAIKVLPPDLAQNAEFRARFEREARALASLRHPNIVQLFDYGNAEHVYYMVLEFIDGQALGDYIRECGALPLDEVGPIIHDIASALDYAHEQGLVHRDVKPSNVMLQKVTATGAGSQQRAILMDFGITKLVTGSTGLTQTGGAIGTLDYMAPEQIMSAREVDKRADVYALGIMVYQMLTGQLPFRNDGLGQLLFAHLQQPAPDPRDLRPDLSTHVATALLKALAKKPDERFQTAGAFAVALS